MELEGRYLDMSIQGKARDQAAPLSIVGVKEASSLTDVLCMGYVCIR